MRVVVLMGGSSAERNVSLASGRGVAQALESEGFEVTALDPASGARLSLADLRRGEIGERPYHTEGATAVEAVRRQSMALARSRELLEGDVVFVALHGGAGEDGTLQALLDLAGVPYTGSGMLASALAMDKARAKVLLGAMGVPTAPGVLLAERDHDFDPAQVGGFPVVVKPNAQGSSVGVHIVQAAAELGAALDDAFQYGPVLVERYIPGREVTVAVLGGAALPVVEIIAASGFYDYRHKYTKGNTRYEVPAGIDAGTAARLSHYGETAFAALGCAGVARVDFRLDPDGNAFCLEVNTVPGMTETSLVPMAAKAAGISYRELVRRLVELAARRAGPGSPR